MYFADALFYIRIRWVIRRGAVIAGVLAILCIAVGSALAAAPAGPRLAFVRFDHHPLRAEVASVDGVGGDTLVLAGGGQKVRPLPYPGSGIAWLPDGSAIVFAGLLGLPEQDEDAGSFLTEEPQHETALFLAAADGSGSRRIPGTRGAVSPVASPDGHTIAFARGRERGKRSSDGDIDTVYESATVWLADLAGATAPRQVTPWRNRLRQIPSSFSPNGATLAVTRLVGDKPPEAIGLEFDGSASSVLARNAIEPVYSPDGTRLAFLREAERSFSIGDVRVTGTFTDLFAKSASGGGLIRLTRTPRTIEFQPSWDPSGQRLAYTAVSPFGSDGALFGYGDALMQINSDGSCPTKVVSYSDAIVLAGTWQPGPGHEAPPIAC